jgi:hypothetical protein
LMKGEWKLTGDWKEAKKAVGIHKARSDFG